MRQKSGKDRANGLLTSRMEDAKADSQGRGPEFLKDSLRNHEGNPIIVNRNSRAKIGQRSGKIRQNQAKSETVGQKSGKIRQNRANGFLTSRIEVAKADSQGRIPESRKDSLRIREGNPILVKPE